MRRIRIAETGVRFPHGPPIFPLLTSYFRLLYDVFIVRKAKKHVRRLTRRHKSRKPLFHSSLLLFAIIAALIIIVFGIVRSQYFDRKVMGDTSRPNFIVIMTDDQRYDSMDAMPITTSRLGGSGITFTHAYLTTPLCCPSRTSFYSSLYVHNTNIWRNNTGYDIFRKKFDNDSIGPWMHQAGYRTGVFGKYLNQYNVRQTPPGWDQWFTIADGRYFEYSANDNGKVRNFEKKTDQYSTDVIRRKAIEFINTSGKPFFLVITPQAPHGNHDGPDEDKAGEAIPAPRHRPCPEITPFRPPNFSEEDTSDKPQWVKKLKRVSTKNVDAFHRAQKCSLKAVDELVGEVLDALEAKGIRENTFVVFYSDNGYMYGEHKLEKKNCTYEACAKTPFIVSYPALAPQGVTSNAMISHIDITATILDLAGVTPSREINGKSFRSVLEDPQTTVRDAVLVEVRNTFTGKQDFSIRTPEYRYTEVGTGEKELYDMINDPWELDNQINNPSYTTTIAELAAKLASLKAE